ncbi:MAG: tetratricopeptide repeat protein [Fidelibacterota bacterium]
MPDLSDLEALEYYFADHFDTVLFPVLAEHYLLRGDFRRAHRVCEIGLEHHPDFVPGLFIRARTYLAEGDLKAAESILKTLTAVDPGHYQAFLLLAEVQTALDRAHSTLQKTYTRLLELDRKNEKARSWLGKKPRKTGRGKPRRVRRSPPRTESPSIPEARPSKSPSSRIEENLASLSISPQIATFTLMSILKSQELYEQALEVLTVMAGKEGTDTARIEEERAVLEDLLALQREEG